MLTNSEVLIAIIGLVGICITAFLSNLDKIFPKENQVIVEFSGYRATGVFETELRYYFEVSGVRKMMDDMASQLLAAQRDQLIHAHPEEAKEILDIFSEIEGVIKSDEVISRLMPVYKNYFSIEEIQELNRFYSTEIMQNMIKKNANLVVESTPVTMEYSKDIEKRVKYQVEQFLLEQQ